MDAGLAFRYARGAAWHLEVALPQVEAAANGAQHADELLRAAGAHLDQARLDALASGSAAAEGVAALSSESRARVVAALEGPLPWNAGHATDVVRGAIAQAQRGVEELAPHLDSAEELLPLSPAATAPASERALVTSVADARRFKRVSETQRALVQRILGEGTIDPEPVRLVGGYGNGNGQLAMVRVRHPETPHLSVLAVRRPPTAQAAQEEFFARLAEHAGVDHHFAPVARRSDGSALVLAVPGRQLWDEVHSGEDVADVMANWYRHRFPTLDDEQVRLAGQLDFDETRSLDYLTAQPDRNAGSPLGDVATGELHFIDNGLAGRGETHDVLRPGLKSHLVGGPAGHAELLREAAEAVTRRLDDARLADAHAVLRRGPDGDLPEGHALALRQDADPRYLDAMRARRDHLREGSFDYEPIPLEANPLAHMDWLQGGRRAW